MEGDGGGGEVAGEGSRSEAVGEASEGEWTLLARCLLCPPHRPDTPAVGAEVVVGGMVSAAAVTWVPLLCAGPQWGERTLYTYGRGPPARYLRACSRKNDLMWAPGVALVMLPRWR